MPQISRFVNLFLRIRRSKPIAGLLNDMMRILANKATFAMTP